MHKYASDAAKQRAYRERLKADMERNEELALAARQLCKAFRQAAECGNPEAIRLTESWTFTCTDPGLLWALTYYWRNVRPARQTSLEEFLEGKSK